MAIGTETLKALVEDEVARVADTRVTTHIRSLPITTEGGWDDTWKQVMLHREQDAVSLYNCDTSIVYERGMTESKFWRVLEWRICHELSGMTDNALAHMWCDGVRGDIMRPEAGPEHMYGTIWIGTDGQTAMQFTMALPDNITSKDGIVWSALVPPEDMTAWLSVDLKRKLVTIDLSKAEPVAD